MPNQLIKRLSLACCSAILCVTISMSASIFAFADDDDQSNFKKANRTKHSYDDNSGTVTVTAEDKQTRSKTSNSTSKNNTGSHGHDETVCHPENPDADTAPYFCELKLVKKTKPRADNNQTARQAANQLTLPLDNPLYGPQPNLNPWGIIPIGYPIWLWTDNTTTHLTNTTTQNGLTITITATRGTTTFNLGDGTQTTCTNPTPRPTHLPNPMQPSPNCGHTYQQPGHYTIQATTTWHINWQTNHETGTLTINRTTQTTTPLTIDELRTTITNHQPHR